MNGQHASDCAVHNEPAYPAGPCDCHLSIESRLDQMIKHAYQGSTEAADEIRQELIERYKAMQPAPVQEPVAWGIIASNTGRICRVELDADEVEDHNPKHIVPLFTAPPQREWQGLTDEEITALKRNGERYISSQDFAKAIEAKLREKNA